MAGSAPGTSEQRIAAEFGMPASLSYETIIAADTLKSPGVAPLLKRRFAPQSAIAE